MISNRECHLARKARAAEQERRDVAHRLAATAQKRLYRDRLKPDGFPAKPFVDVTVLYAKDHERAVMRALSEGSPS